MSVFLGIMIPFVGTALGAACVFLLKNDIRDGVQKALLGFASGIMVAASVWSLLIPAMDMSENMGKLRFIPAVVGFLIGIGFILALDTFVPHQHIGQGDAEGIRKNWSKSVKLVLAVTLHNIPEGMAVGVVFAGMIADNTEITLAGAFALSIGIAVQNFPEGAIVSMPLRSEENMNRGKAFIYGAASGIVEPAAAGITILLRDMLVPFLPYLLAFAAGAMIYVVVEELIPEANEGKHSNIGTVGFAVGFSIMMVLDVALG
ncbi:MAG: ZIP family metal transporter [Eubacteriales bacterium]|nr:ZIP family metal transporter [Eubacteriales bacterium]